ncbi:murein L,D-transpeptidase [Desulfurivibrio sp. C05AmB]|uniref:L,D-transpeptidase family protein n=1 Tax=Desulfurivibrio sp. C05AmB TaxID=3374371 RepID=UPI00376ED854
MPLFIARVVKSNFFSPSPSPLPAFGGAGGDQGGREPDNSLLVKELKFKMKKLFLLILFVGACLTLPDQASALSDQGRELLRTRIEEAGLPAKILVGDEEIYSSVVLPRFYFDRTFQLAWSDDDGPLPLADDMVAAIRGANREGLIPEDYHLAKIEETLGRIRNTRQQGEQLNPLSLVDLDLLLTDAFLVLASHFHSGRINPETFTPEWHPSKRDADFAAILGEALQENRIGETLEGLLPKHLEYLRLREAFARYQKISEEGGWPGVPEGPTLRKGDSSERVIALRERLMLAGDLAPHAPAEAAYFDALLEDAVKSFQLRHSLDPDGIVGRETLADLNVSIEQRLIQSMINLERWRWMPEFGTERYILVNIANFELNVFERNEPVMNMRVIVGRHYRQTPVFTGTMTYLVLNPYWNVPPGIAVNDILPEVKKELNYLAENNMRVFQGWGASAVQVDPATVDWQAITARNLPYRFRQDPGPDNALGRVKFMFPNKYHVYLHDTPRRELFWKVARDFSSGCIRVEKPFELAEYLLSDRPEWTRERIEATIATNVERTVTINRPIPVHLSYWTAWADQDGTINFRRDIYRRDERLYAALQDQPVPPLAPSPKN